MELLFFWVILRSQNVHFPMSHPIAFSTCIVLCRQQTSSISCQLSPSKEKPGSLGGACSSPTPSCWRQSHKQSPAVSDLLCLAALPAIMCFRFIHVFTCFSASFLLMAGTMLHCTGNPNNGLFICSSADRHFNCSASVFWLLWIMLAQTRPDEHLLKCLFWALGGV